MYQSLSPILYVLAFPAFCAGVWNCYLARLLWKEKQCSCTVAKLVHIKSQKNVRARTRGVSGPFVTVPHTSTGTYVYTANGKEYRLKGWARVAPGQLPKQPQVIYLTRLPHHAYLKGTLMYLPELPWTMLWFVGALLLWLLAKIFATGAVI